MPPNFIVGQKIIWRRTGEIAYIYAWREQGSELQVQLHPRGPFWNMWFFKLHEDGNDILKGML